MKRRSFTENPEILKEQGHRLMDSYKEITGLNSEKAYLKLKEKMRGKAWHFGQMNDEKTIKLAIGYLKKMIASETYKVHSQSSRQ